MAANVMTASDFVAHAQGVVATMNRSDTLSGTYVTAYHWDAIKGWTTLPVTIPNAPRIGTPRIRIEDHEDRDESNSLPGERIDTSVDMVSGQAFFRLSATIGGAEHHAAWQADTADARRRSHSPGAHPWERRCPRHYRTVHCHARSPCRAIRS